MEFRRIRKRKKPNYIRAIILIVLLLIIIYIMSHAEGISERFFGKRALL